MAYDPHHDICLKNTHHLQCNMEDLFLFFIFQLIL
jgi:hypothetical protein